MNVSALFCSARALPIALAVVVAPSGGGGTPSGTEPGRLERNGEAYYQFLMGKMSRLDGALGEAAEHLEQAAGADDSSVIRVELAQTYMRMGDLPRAIEHARAAAELAPEDVDARRALAEAYLASAYKGDDREGSTSRAIAEYQTLVRLAPSDGDSRMMLGRLLLQEDRPQEALEQFAALKKAGADPVLTGMLISRSLLRLQKNEEAESELRAVLALAPHNFEALSTLAQITEARGNWDETSDLYRRMLAQRPSDTALSGRLAAALIRAGRGTEAIAVLHGATTRNPSDRVARMMLAGALRAVGRPGEALHELSVLLEYESDDPSLLIEIGRIHESRSETEPALDAYRRARSAAGRLDKTLETSPDKPPEKTITPDLNAGLVLTIAVLELESGNPQAALRTLEEIPDDGSAVSADAAMIRARSLIAAGKPGRAAEVASRLVERQGESNARAALVLLEARLASSRDAAAAARSLAEFKPASRSPRELASAADTLRKAGFTKLGLSVLEESLAAHPSDASVHFALGAFQQSAGNYAESEKHLRRALELDPGNAPVLNYLGYSLADRGRDLPYAESLIRRALEDDPLSGAFLDSLGWALLKQNRLDEAETALLKAADLQAGDGTVREHLGDLYHRKGDMTRALTEWRTAQSLRPEDPERLRKKVQSALKEAARR